MERSIDVAELLMAIGNLAVAGLLIFITGI